MVALGAYHSRAKQLMLTCCRGFSSKATIQVTCVIFRHNHGMSHCFAASLSLYSGSSLASQSLGSELQRLLYQYITTAVMVMVGRIVLQRLLATPHNIFRLRHVVLAGLMEDFRGLSQTLMELSLIHLAFLVIRS